VAFGETILPSEPSAAAGLVSSLSGDTDSHCGRSGYYAIGGSGPTSVLLHGYPQTWYLSEPAHLRANLAWFRTLPLDMAATAQTKNTKLGMPVLAVGAEGSLGEFVGTQVREYADHVTAIVVGDCGHWLYEERPEEMTQQLLAFLDS